MTRGPETVVQVRVRVLGDGTVTVAKASVVPLDWDEPFVQASSHAVRDNHDPNRDEVGTLLATGRALQAVGRKLERRGMGLVKHRDDVKAMREEAKKRPKLKKARRLGGSADG